LLKFRFKKFKKLRRNFLKVFDASLAVLNLFTGNLYLEPIPKNSAMNFNDFPPGN
jgi:hypothetical protein